MAMSNTEYAKSLPMPAEYQAQAAAFADARGLSLAAREVVAAWKDGWVGRDGRKRPPALTLIVTADALMALALRDGGRKFAAITTEWTADGREWLPVWLASEPPAACRVTFEVEGIDAPVVVVHTWAEYTQGKATSTQLKMPALTLAKSTRSLGVRQIAPTATAGLLSEEEAHAVEASVDAEIESASEIAEVMTPLPDREAKGSKISRAEQYAARKEELAAIGKALRADMGDEAAGKLGAAIKALGADVNKLTAKHLKSLIDTAKDIRAEFEKPNEPDTASKGSWAEAQQEWKEIGKDGEMSVAETVAEEVGGEDEFVI